MARGDAHENHFVLLHLGLIINHTMMEVNRKLYPTIPATHYKIINPRAMPFAEGVSKSYAAWTIAYMGAGASHPPCEYGEDYWRIVLNHFEMCYKDNKKKMPQIFRQSLYYQDRPFGIKTEAKTIREYMAKAPPRLEDALFRKENPYKEWGVYDDVFYTWQGFTVFEELVKLSLISFRKRNIAKQDKEQGHGEKLKSKM